MLSGCTEPLFYFFSYSGVSDMLSRRVCMCKLCAYIFICTALHASVQQKWTQLPQVSLDIYTLSTALLYTFQIKINNFYIIGCAYKVHMHWIVCRLRNTHYCCGLLINNWRHAYLLKPIITFSIFFQSHLSAVIGIHLKSSLLTCYFCIVNASMFPHLGYYGENYAWAIDCFHKNGPVIKYWTLRWYWKRLIIALTILTSAISVNWDWKFRCDS